MAIGIGLDVGGTKVLGCALDRAGQVLGELRLASVPGREGLVGVLATAVAQLVDGLGARAGDVAGVGVGLPGLVDRDGVLHETANLQGVEGLSVPGALRSRLSPLLSAGGAHGAFTLAADNDATCAAVAEHAFGAGRGVEDSVTVTLGTGIGGGIVANGQVVRGGRSFAAELGHMVVDPSGPRCGCGRRGCWERFASGTGLAFLARRAAGEGRAPGLVELAGGEVEAVRGEHVVQAAREADPGALAVVEEYGSYLALGLANLAEILDPARIILGGGLAAAGEVLFGPALAAYAAGSRRGSGPRAVPVVMGELGARAGALGAGALALGVLS